MVQPSSNGMVVEESQAGKGGGVLIGSLHEVQPGDTRRPSLSSTLSDESIGSSLTSSHSSSGSVASDSDTMSNGDVSGRGMGGVDGGGGAEAEAEAGRSKRSLMTAGEEHPVAQPSSQLRKACDLCTKRKRKCNGQHPCSQCIETGMRSQCIYSPRLKSGRKKKVRIDGVLYEEGVYGGELTLAANSGARRQAVDPSVGRFSASGAVGLAGHVENFFLATYLRDFNRIVPLTTESSVTEGMLEVLSPAVSSRGLATANPIKQPESRRQAKLAVFWGVVAMGSRILGASDDATVRYLGLMRTALRECFDCNDKEVVQAYLLLSTVETMRGNEAAGKRYLDHAHTMHNGNAMGPEGKLLRDRSEQDESLDLVFQIYDQPDGCVGGFNRSAAVGGDWKKISVAAPSPSPSCAPPATAAGSGGRAAGEPSSAVDQMIAQAMAPPSDSQSSPLKALKYLSTACGLSSEVFDPTNKCVTVKQYLSEMDSALKGAHSLFVATDLGECVTGVMMVKIWGGVTVVMRSWGKLQDRNIGLAQVEEGVGYALTRPGLFTFPMWWHALHCAAVTLAHFGRNDIYMRLRATFNKHTFPGTEMPPIDTYAPGSVCPQLGGSCSKLAYWLQVRGAICGEPEWKPHFTKGHLSEASENAAYAAALDRGTSCAEKANGAAAQVLAQALRPSPQPINGADLVDGSPVRAALDAGLNEISANFDDLSGLEALAGAELGLDLNLNPLGVEFDLSQLIQEPDNADNAENADNANLNSNREEAEACLEACQAGGAAEIAAAVRRGEPPPASTGTENMPMNTMQVPPGLVAGRGGGAAGGAGAAALLVSGAAAPVITGGGEMSRDPSFGISGPAAVGWAGAAAVVSSAEEALSRQSSIDINTLMQMANSDEELKKNEGGSPDAIDNALAFGEGPAKEMFGVELSKP